MQVGQTFTGKGLIPVFPPLQEPLDILIREFLVEQVGPDPDEIISPGGADPDDVDVLEVREEQVIAFLHDVGVHGFAHAVLIRPAGVSQDQGVLAGIQEIGIIDRVAVELVHGEQPVDVTGVDAAYDLLGDMGEVGSVIRLRGLEHVEPGGRDDLSGRKDGPCVVQVDLAEILDDLKGVFVRAFHDRGPEIGSLGNRFQEGRKVILLKLQ